MNPQLTIPKHRLAAFCQANEVRRLWIFGSAVRDDFGPESDIDVLVEFAKEARHSLFDMVRMEEELREVFGRKVDLVERAGVERSRNYLHRKAILDSAETIYAA